MNPRPPRLLLVLLGATAVPLATWPWPNGLVRSVCRQRTAARGLRPAGGGGTVGAGNQFPRPR
jgi:hypothetical protein